MVVAIIVCVVATLVPALPTQAICITPPEITLIPSWGVPGDTVTIIGEHFGDRSWADIYYDGTWIEEVQSNGAGALDFTITIPESPKGKHQVLAAVKINDETYEAVAYFDVWPGLTVSPERGPVGTNVTVTGRGFVEDETILDVRYYLAGTFQTVAENIPVDADGRWETIFHIPPSTRGQHKIDAWGSSTIRAAVRHVVFTVGPGISAAATSGSAGQSITVKGSGFAPDETGIRILLDERPVRTDITANLQGDWTASFEVPEMPKGTYNLTAEGESTWRRDVGGISFSVGSSLTLYPAEGHVGMEVAVTGHGFPAREDVVIMYGDTQVKTARADQEGSFNLSFAVPEGPRGARQVTASVAPDPNGTAGTGTNVSVVFTMESDPPPTPEAASPVGGARVGLLRKATPTFTWSEVDDASGVSYSLQISARDEVTEAGQFVDPMVSVQGLTGTSYTPETGPLPYGRYYWTVRAVDGAENESGWSEAHSFRVGLMPRWAFILCIVVLVLLLLFLVRLLVIRRTYYY